MAQFPKSVWIKAVEQKCAECIYDPSQPGGTWRNQVLACTDAACPLYPIRPLPQGLKHAENPAIPNLVKRRQLEAKEV